MIVVPCTLKEAEPYVREHHRHSVPRGSGKFAIAVEVAGERVGVAIAGRPTNRHLDDGATVEVLRVCTDGTRNACSFLYGRVHRIARVMGYRKAITYTLASEPGSSVLGAGYTLVARVKPDDAQRPGRKRTAREAVPRLRWERAL